MNDLESRARLLPRHRDCPSRGGAFAGRPRRALGCAWRCRSRSTTSTSGCCATRRPKPASRRARAGASSTAASTTPRRARRGSSSSRPSSTACRCCASSSPTCIPTTSARRTGCASAGRAPVDQRHRLRHRPDGERRRAPASAARSRPPSWRMHGLAADPRRGRRRRGAHQLLHAAWCRSAGAYRRLLDGRSRSARRGARRLDLPRRLRPRARAHRPALRRQRAC